MSARPVILNLPPAPGNLTAPSPPPAHNSNWDEDSTDDDQDDSRTESGRSTSTFTASETGTETYSFSYASTNYGDVTIFPPNSLSSELFSGQPSNLDASALMALAQSGTPLLPLLQLEGGDTYIFLTPSSTSHKLVQMRYNPPMRVPSSRLLATKSQVFQMLLSEPAQRRIITRLVKQKKLVPNRDGNPLPAGIKYALDLTPEEEGERAVEWVEMLWCPDEVMSWHSMTEPMSVTTPLDNKGEPDFMAIIRQNEAEQRKALKRFEWGTAGSSKDNDTEGIEGDENKKETEVKKEQDEGVDVKMEESKGKKEDEQKNCGEETKPQNYSFERHLLSLERLIHIIHNLDPMVSSTPDWYTLHCLSVYFGTTDATRDYIAKWIYSNYPTIVEQHPHLIWKVAIEAGLVNIAADAWSSAVMGMGTSIPRNPEAVPGAIEGRKAFEERVEEAFDGLFSDNKGNDDVMMTGGAGTSSSGTGPRGKWIEQYLPQCTDQRMHVMIAYDNFTFALKDYIINRLTRLVNPPSPLYPRTIKMERILQTEFWTTLRGTKFWSETDHECFLNFLQDGVDGFDVTALKRVNKTWVELEELWNEMEGEGEGEVDIMEMIMKDKTLPKEEQHKAQLQKEQQLDKEENKDKHASMDTLVDVNAPAGKDEDEDDSSVADMKGSEYNMEDEDWDDVTVDDKTTIADDKSILEDDKSVVSGVSAIRRKTESMGIFSTDEDLDHNKGKDAATTPNASSSTLNVSHPESPTLKKVKFEEPEDDDDILKKFDIGQQLLEDVNPHGNNPLWLSSALINLRNAYPNGDEFWGITVPRGATDLSSDGKPVNPTFVSFNRIICRDCPEKMYFTGPGYTADNFMKHLSLPLHRQRVYNRLVGNIKQEPNPSDYNNQGYIAPKPTPFYNLVNDPNYTSQRVRFSSPPSTNDTPSSNLQPTFPHGMKWPKDLVHIMNTCQYHVTSVANSMLQVNVDFDLLLLENVLSCLDETERRFMPLWAGGEVTTTSSATTTKNGKGKERMVEVNASDGAAFPSAVSTAESVMGEVSTLHGGSSVASTVESGVLVDTPEGSSSGFEDLGEGDEAEGLLESGGEEDDDFDLMDEASDEAFGL